MNDHRLQEGSIAIVECHDLVRFAFAFDGERFLFIRLSETEVHVFDPDGKELIDLRDRLPSLTESIYGFVFDKDAGIRLARPPRRRNVKQIQDKVPLANLFREFAVPDMRLAGLWNYERIGDNRDFNSWLGCLNTQDRILQTSHVGTNKLRMDFLVRKDASDVPSAFLKMDLDPTDFTPSRVAWLGPGTSLLSPRRLARQERVQWVNREGINLPEFMRVNSTINRGIAEGMNFSLNVGKEARVHWFGINHELAEAMFDSENIPDLSKMRELVSPRDAKAD